MPISSELSFANRDKQRRSRARRHEYLRSLEEKVRIWEKQGAIVTREIQSAAQSVSRQNEILRDWLVRSLDVSHETLQYWLKLEIGSSDAQFSRQLTSIRAESIPKVQNNSYSKHDLWLQSERSNANHPISAPVMIKGPCELDARARTLNAQDHTDLRVRHDLEVNWRHSPTTTTAKTGAPCSGEPDTCLRARATQYQLPQGCLLNHTVAAQADNSPNLSQPVSSQSPLLEMIPLTRSSTKLSVIGYDCNAQEYCSKLMILALAAESVPYNQDLVSCAESYKMLQPVLGDKISIGQAIEKMRRSLQVTERGVMLSSSCVLDILGEIELQECRKYTVEGLCC